MTNVKVVETPGLLSKPFRLIVGKCGATHTLRLNTQTLTGEIHTLITRHVARQLESRAIV